MDTRPEKVQVLHRPHSVTDEVAAQLRDTSSISHQAKPIVLIVDDIKLTVRVTKKSLSGDWECEVARDGEEAVGMALKNVYKIILMDVNLPKLSGTEATKRIRENESDKGKKNVIFGLTASFDSEDLDLYAQSGMDGCIAKGSVLRRAVKAAVDAKRRAREGQFIFVDEENQVTFRGAEESDDVAMTSSPMLDRHVSAGLHAHVHPAATRPLHRPKSLGHDEFKSPFVGAISPSGRTLPVKPDSSSFRFNDVDASDMGTFNKLHGDSVGDFRKNIFREKLAKQRTSKTPPGQMMPAFKKRVARDTDIYGDEENRHYSKSCLLVDDNPLTVKVTTRAVKTSGMRCDVAVDGKAAVQKAFKGQYQLILMDVMLPGFDGCEATQRIRDHEDKNNLKNVPILGLTGNTDIDDLKRYAKSGMDGCIEKGATIKTAIKAAISIMKENKTSFVFINGKNVQSLPCERSK